MENGKFDEIARILRHTTLIVKIFPFIYVGIYVLCMMVYPVVSDEAAALLDSVFYVSPVMMAAFIMLSYSLRLCVYHRLQVCLPLILSGAAFIDDYIYEFGVTGFYVNLTAVILVCILSLFNGFKIFLRK